MQPGDVLHLYVSTTPAASYRVEIFRLGWYNGAGGRRVACLPSCSGSEQGATQPLRSPDPATGELDAGWLVTDGVSVGPDWTTGYYVAKLILTGGPNAGQASWVPFIVRAPPGASSAILVQASVNTWEAYNNWGGKSLYSFNSTASSVSASHTNAAAMVSFNRPYAEITQAFEWEYNLVRFLERHGYDVSYQTDVDTDLNPSSLLRHRVDVVSGHDEYWSPTMRDAYEAARSAGVNLAFLGGNIGYWQARYANSDRTLIEYRNATYDPAAIPSQKTVQFAQPPVNRPECQLLGVGYAGGLAVAGDPPRPYVVTQAAGSNPWFQGAGLAAGASIFDSVGYEWDAVQPGCAAPPLRVLFHFAGLTGVSGSGSGADAVTYTAQSGAHVISNGSLQVVWALDDYWHTPHADPRVQALFTNIFNSLGSVPVRTASNPEPQLLQPARGAAVRSPVLFRWSNPLAGQATYRLTIDGRVAAVVNAATCSGSCSAIVTTAEGSHQWSVQASGGLGNPISSQTSAFTVDNTPPDRFVLRAPRSRAVLWNPRPTLTWQASHDLGSGLAPYLVMVDGKLSGTTTRTSYGLPTDLSDGLHSWTVVAVDRAGNRQAASTRTFWARSVRFIRRSHSQELAHGVELKVYCGQGCTIRAWLRVRIAGRASSVGSRLRTAGVATVIVPLSVTFGRTLKYPGPHRLFLTVLTRSSAAGRYTQLIVRW